jgi:hypothetical protein
VSAALLSIVRLHKVQAMMNLRQVLEAGAAAAFAQKLRHVSTLNNAKAALKVEYNS